MYGTDGSMGFQPYILSGAMNNTCSEFTQFINPSVTGNVIYNGDPVIISGGFLTAVTQTTGTTISSTTPQTNLKIAGVFSGCEYVLPNSIPTSPGRPYWSNPTLASGIDYVEAYMHNAREQTYNIQADNSTAISNATALSCIGRYADFIWNTGSSDTGWSKCVLKLSSAVVAAGSHPLKIVGITPHPSNFTYEDGLIAATYTNFLVKFVDLY